MFTNFYFRVASFMLNNPFDYSFSHFSAFSSVKNFLPSSWHYSGFGTKLSPIFGFAKSSQIQDHFSIKPNAQIRCSGCWRLPCVLRCLRIRRYKSSLKRQHNFIRDDRLYEGSETSHAKKCGGLTKDFE